jgi:hypothetical protein
MQALNRDAVAELDVLEIEGARVDVQAYARNPIVAEGLD